MEQKESCLHRFVGNENGELLCWHRLRVTGLHKDIKYENPEKDYLHGYNLEGEQRNKKDLNGKEELNLYSLRW